MKYRKKPVVIEAEIYRMGLEDGWVRPSEVGMDLTGLFYRVNPENGKWEFPYIQTLEGRFYIHWDSWIITGPQGERYPLKPDIFEQTYEKVEG